MKTLTLTQFQRRLISLDEDLEQATIRGLRSSALRMVELTMAEISGSDPHPAVDRGELRNSVEYTREDDGGSVEVTAPHAAIIEEGTRPFWPPAEPLIRWMVRKGLAENEDEAEEEVWAIQAAIAQRGIEPRRYFATAFDRVQPIIAGEISRELGGVK